MAKEITFEIYIQQGGRWLLEARFNNSQKDQAIEEARQIEKQSKLESIKVVREVYDDDNNLIKEQIVYQGKGRENGAGGGPGGGGGPSSPSRPSPSRPSPSRPSPSRPSPEPSRGGDPTASAASPRRARAPAGAGPAAAAPRQKRATAAVAAVGRGAAVRATGTGLGAPEAIVLYKLLVVGAVSFGFAILVTFAYGTYF